MPGKLFKGQGEVVTPYLGNMQVHGMYLGSTSISYDSRFPTFISASGGTIYDSGSWRYHLFTSSADFTIDSVPLSQLNSRIEVLVVGAGGGGCSFDSGSNSPGGGSGGAVVHIPYSANYRLNVGTYNIVIGTGGLGQNDNVPRNPATVGQPSYVTSSIVELYALGGIFQGATFVSQSGLPGLSGQYGHNYGSGQGSSQGSPGGGGAGEVGGSSPTIGCTAAVGGDGYLVDTFPFAPDWEFRSNDKWGAGGGGTSYPGGGCGVTWNGGDGGESGGGKGKGTTTPINPAEQSGYPNTGGGGGANVNGSKAGNGATGFVGFRYRIA